MNRRRRKNLHITCLINNTDSWIRIKATKFIDDPCKVTFLCSMKLCEKSNFYNLFRGDTIPIFPNNTTTRI